MCRNPSPKQKYLAKMNVYSLITNIFGVDGTAAIN